MGKDCLEEEEQAVISGYINGITITVSTEEEKEKLSVVNIDAASQVVDSRLGLPNLSSQCSTCGHKNPQRCEGHFGLIELPFTIIHPHFLSEVAKILNHVCPACKKVRKDEKGRLSRYDGTNCCVYCARKPCYPRMRFRVSTQDAFRKTALMVEVAENKLKKLKERFQVSDYEYWKFIPYDDLPQHNSTKSNSRVLSHAQVHSLLSDVDPKIIQKFVSRSDVLFLNSLPVTPNCHRVTEVAYPLFNEHPLRFDERTKAYKRLVGFRGSAIDISSYVLDCLKVSKLARSDISNSESVFRQNKIVDTVSQATGLRWMKDVVLGKRNDYSIRMVVTGDPNIRLSEIGIPRYIAERLQISEVVTRWNHEKVRVCCDLLILEKGVVTVRRNDRVVRIHRSNQLKIGDSMYRHILEGDILLVLRPPSIHQHSLIGLYVKILPNSSNFSLNPLCCSPLRGDFDGDCLHGYIPQSVDARVELMELVSLRQQLINGQTGRSLLSLSQDSLTAAHLAMEDEVFLNQFQMQQLQMYTSYNFPCPAVIKTPSLSTSLWTGKQIINMLLPQDFSFVHSLSGVHISEGEVLTHSKGSAFVNDTDTNLFQGLVKHCEGKIPEFLFAAQEVFCEWLCMRGLSVSLSDLYLATDSSCRKNLMNDVHSGLEDAEEASNVKATMINSHWQLFAASGEKKSSLQLEHLFYQKQKSAALSLASFDAFKKVFWAVQNLVHEYKGRDNSLWSMYRAGSKGNLLRIVQQSMCLGLQHSMVPLSFSFPQDLSCTGWNNQKLSFSASKAYDIDCSNSYVPCAVVKGSYLSGLNPLEAFVHSVVSRDSAFGKHADLPGTLSRKLMFFLRDICIGYDGTVRNSYGSQLVQLTYNVNKNASSSSSGDQSLYGEAGQPVGALSACAISEVAYSALDQPIGLLETSPLLNLKNVLECGSKKGNGKQVASLFLSNKLERWQHGYEYGALEVKNHLERLFFEDIVSSVMIVFSPQSQKHFSPWVCHFHVCKELAKRKGLNANFIITSLRMWCSSSKLRAKSNLPCLLISSKYCPVAETYKESEDTFCITVSIIENPKKPSESIDSIQNFIIPFLLQTVIKGFMEISKVDILWNDRAKYGSSRRGELYLRVSISGESSKTKCWNLLMDRCLPIMDMIDWNRSHPDSISAFSDSFGIAAGRKYFLDNLESAISDIGKNVLPEHLHLVANALSMSGEFVGLNAKGISQQREHASVSSPFMQACFSRPGDCFAKAAKSGTVDRLNGSIDALAWGNVPPVGTGGPFDIIYAGEGTSLLEPTDIYCMLSSQVSSPMPDVEIELPNGGSTRVMHSEPTYKGHLRCIPKAVGSCWTINDIQKLAHAAKRILMESPINQYLRERDRSTLIQILNFHPQRDEKIGSGAHNIKVAYHPKYQTSRCFKLVRQDGTVTDFSYHKCVQNALEMIAPEKAKLYRSKHFG